jgi:hypothetical protein
MEFAVVHEGIDDPDQCIDCTHFCSVGSIGCTAYQVLVCYLKTSIDDICWHFRYPRRNKLPLGKVSICDTYEICYQEDFHKWITFRFTSD